MHDLTFVIKNDLQEGMQCIITPDDNDWFYLDRETQLLVMSVQDALNPWSQ